MKAQEKDGYVDYLFENRFERIMPTYGQMHDSSGHMMIFQNHDVLYFGDIFGYPHENQ